jgi:hypothetical protein
LRSSTSSPATATEEEDEHHHELEKSNRTLALKWSRSRHPWRRRIEANGCRPSTGTTPPLLPLPDLCSPSSHNRRGKKEPDPANHQPQHPRTEPHPNKSRPTATALGGDEDAPSLDSHANLLDPAVSAEAEHRREKGGVEKDYSAATSTPSPHQRRPEEHAAEDLTPSKP